MPRSGVPLPLVVAVLVAAGAIPATAPAAPALTVSAEAGPEYDTNVLRVPAAPDTSCACAPGSAGCRCGATDAALLRLTASGSLRLRPANRHELVLGYGGGGKLFVGDAARSADELVQFATAAWTARLGAAALGVGGGYYDAFQRSSVRDFRTATASLQAVLLDLPHALRPSFHVGHRYLQYKPLDDYSFQGPEGGVGLRWRLSSGRGDAAVDWVLRLEYGAGLRFYNGRITALPSRCRGDGSTFPCTEATARRDLHHHVLLEASYLGPAEAALSYTVEVNRSTSYGETYHRHVVALRFTTALVWGLFLTAKGTLQLSRFQDPFLVSEVSNLTFLSVDDENRSSLVLQVARELSERWSLVLRYGLHVNESTARTDPGLGPATPLGLGGFLRQTVFLGARVEYGSE